MFKTVLILFKKRIFVLLLLLFFFQLTRSQKNIASGTIEFEFVSKKVDGSIGGLASSSSINFDDLNASLFEGSVAVDAIKTGNFLRDWALKGGKYFDEDSYPLITFKSKTITADTEGIKVEGDLTIKDITKPIIINFILVENELKGNTTLYSSDFGIQIKKKREDNKVEVVFKFNLE
ncbi:YceI family protein [Muriicola sp. Z0-33]|uniref:YceI family protein n=1 Tax=Muriicola sp. Z0-33 TaxID=2816957 RepID=UPI002238DC80|nr:YceI family protein [Muriicola sp. Z0-33]MCW5515309.1 YceI family protein [Muriicola sp. Z0-33]